MNRDQTLHQLAQRIRLIESTRPTPALAIALGGLGPLFPGSQLAGGMLVELIVGSEGAGAWSLALALAKCACGADRLLLVADPQHCFYPPAAIPLGIDLRQLAVARCDSVKDALLAASQALRCPAVGAVVGQFDRLSERDGRRLQLAAESGGGLGIFVRPAAALHAPSFAAVRLLLAPLPSVMMRRRISVQLVRCHVRARALSEGLPVPLAGRSGSETPTTLTALVEIDDETGDVRAFSPLDAATPAPSSPRPAG